MKHFVIIGMDDNKAPAFPPEVWNEIRAAHFFGLANTVKRRLPDAVFIGGHGGHLAEIISKAAALMQPGGCVVFNAVTQSGKAAFLEGAVASGLRVMLPVRAAIDNYNPIDIMKALL